MNTYLCECVSMFITLTTWYIPEFDYWGYAREQAWSNQSILPNIPGI